MSDTKPLDYGYELNPENYSCEKHKWTAGTCPLCLQEQLAAANERVNTLNLRCEYYKEVLNTCDYTIDSYSKQIKELEEENEAMTDHAIVLASRIHELEAEVAELRSRYLGIDKTYELVEQGRKETAQAIHDMIKPKVWPNNKYIVGTTCDILDKIVERYGL